MRYKQPPAQSCEYHSPFVRHRDLDGRQRAIDAAWQLCPDPWTDSDTNHYLIDAQKVHMTIQSELAEADATFEQEDSEQPIPPADIVAYNELRSCADLFRMHASGKLEIQPDFQRDVVWKQDDQSRFIDSLVKQLPIPSMCFSLDYKTQRWKVTNSQCFQYWRLFDFYEDGLPHGGPGRLSVRCVYIFRAAPWPCFMLIWMKTLKFNANKAY